MKAKLNDNEKVKVCPLCASKAFLCADRIASGKAFFWVKCDNLQCGCTINSDKDRKTVLTRWNQRW